MTLEGYFYEPGNSHRSLARFNVDGIKYDLIVSEESIKVGVISDLSFSERIGNTPRKVIFKDGSVFETQNNNQIDKVVSKSGNENLISRLLQVIENKWRWAITSIAFLILLGYFIISVILPWAGRELAYIVPNKVNETISSGAMGLLDEQWFDKSELSDDKKNEIQESFSDLINALPNNEFNYKLNFRSMNGAANAFSLPDGQIIITDELVRLSENPKQINAILLHEIGHTHNRHVMQQMIRSSMISVAISMATSDLSALEDLIVVLPVFLIKSGYSQDAENEADKYMLDQMVRLQINPIHFANIMQKITQDESNSGSNVLKYFASHPEPSMRVKKALKISNEFFGEI